jgi:aconitate hydratase
VVIAAITSCTNTSNPAVMLAAGLLARAAVERGVAPRPWVKASLAPGSHVVMDYLDRAGLTEPLAALGFDLVGFGCTTCIGNSGPLAPEVAADVREHDLAVAAVLSGNRNFEGRINPDVRLNFLASPPLVVAYALAGTVDIDLTTEPLGQDADGRPVSLADLWPDDAELRRAMAASVDPQLFLDRYADPEVGDRRWADLPIEATTTMAWDAASTYLRLPPFVDEVPADPPPLTDITGARILAWLGDSVTTDHISPAGSIPADSDAGRWLVEHGVDPPAFNSYGSRRGNHEVMVRGTFANIRLRNRLAPGTSGSVTRHWPSGDQASIFTTARRYQEAGVPSVVLAGKDYGTGSSRDWAAKGTALLGVRAVLAESFERIHRSNLIGMGVLPLQFPSGQSAEALGLRGDEEITITGLEAHGDTGLPPTVRVQAGAVELDAVVRIDTPREETYYRHGGILPFIVRREAGAS